MVRLSKRDETWASLQFVLVNLIVTFYINASIITNGWIICYLGDKDRSVGGHWLFWVTELVSLWRFISVQRHGRLYVCAFDSGSWKHLRLTSVTESLLFTSISFLQAHWMDFLNFISQCGHFSSSGTCNFEPHWKVSAVQMLLLPC